MKIQPINDVAAESESTAVSAVVEVVKPVVRSRLRRLFRISVAEKDEQRLPPPAVVETVEEAEAVEFEFEPSSVCLAKMVRNFIEENNERQVTSVKCGRNRCNCFNGNGSDGSDGETDAVDVRDYLKRLVINTSVNERKVKGETGRVMGEKSKGCKRKEEVRKVVMEGLMAIGYDASICKSKWDKSPSFPAGEYEYVDVIVGGERLIIDIDFRSEFEVARSTKTYKSILQILPNIFVGKSDRLSKIICIVSEAAKQSLKKKGMHIPPWRKANYVQAKWLSPPTRLVINSSVSTPTTSPLLKLSPLVISDVQNPVPKSPQVDEPEESSDSSATAIATTSPPSQFPSLVISDDPFPDTPAPDLATLPETSHSDEPEASDTSSSSSLPETFFDMSESSEEDMKVKLNEKGDLSIFISPKKNLKIVSGLASIIEEKP